MEVMVEFGRSGGNASSGVSREIIKEAFFMERKWFQEPFLPPEIRRPGNPKQEVVIMSRQAYAYHRLQVVGIVLSVMVITMSVIPCVFAQESRKLIGILPLNSAVANVPSDAAHDLFIKAVMSTNRFTIRPPESNGSFTGVEYVLEPTLTEGKSQSNALGFLKNTVLADTPINLSVRVY
jgi:hypothetical protein